MLNSTALRVARAKMNISQKEIAKRVGITQSHYNRLEHGRQNGSIRTIQLISKVLGIPIEEILALDKD